MDREVNRLRREYRRDPGAPGVALALAQALLRSGDRGGAFATADPRAVAGDPAARALRDEIWGGPAWVGRPELVPAPLPPGHEVLSLAFDAADRRLAVGRTGGALEVLDLETGDRVELTAHARAVTALAFAADTGELISGGGDGAVRGWDLGTRAATRSMRGPGSRCLRVRTVAGRLEGRWWGDVVLAGDAGPTRTPTDFPFLVPPDGAPDLPAGFAAAVLRRVQELFPDTRPFLGGLFGTDRAKGFRPAKDPRVAVFSGPRGQAWALLIAGGVEVYPAGEAETPRRVVRDPDLCLPRGVAQNQGIAAALGAAGRVLVIGGAAPEARGSERVARVFDLAGDAGRLRWSLPGRITAACVSPGGGAVAFGTRAGRVLFARLHPRREDGGAVIRAAPEVTRDRELVDLREDPGAPPAAPGAFRLLRSIPARRFRRKPRALWLGREHLFAYLGVARRDRFDDPATRPLYPSVYRFDLATGRLEDLGVGLHADGKLYRYGRRWAPFGGPRSVAAPVGTDLGRAGLPAGPDPGRWRGRAAVARAIGAEPKDRFGAPRGGVLAVRARGRPQEFWLVDPARPEAARHFEPPGRIQAMAWSPGGTRLAVLLKDRGVWIYGAGGPAAGDEPG